MNTFYFFCAIFGSAFILLQFFLLLFVGIGTDSDTGDITSVDTETGMEMDANSGDTDGSLDSDAVEHYHDGGQEHGSSSFGFLKMLSLRTITAGIGFLGFAGLASESFGFPEYVSLFIAIVFGIAAIVLVYFLYRFINAFSHSGSLQEGSQLGCSGTVTIRIPPKRGGPGRVQINQQERTMEYEAVTDSEEELKTGVSITVVKILSSAQVVVEKKIN